jgi:hypothetical protein
MALSIIPEGKVRTQERAAQLKPAMLLRDASVQMNSQSERKKHFPRDAVHRNVRGAG